MQAIIQTGGKQYTVSEGMRLDVELLEAQSGEEISFENVLMVSDDASVKVGAPNVAGAVVKGKVIAEVKGVKTRSLKMRRRKDSRCVKGHRQHYHRVLITSIVAG